MCNVCSPRAIFRLLYLLVGLQISQGLCHSEETSGMGGKHYERRELLHRELGTRDDLEWWRIGVSGMVYVEIPRRNRQSCVVELESDLKIVKDDCTKSCSGKVRFIALVNALSYC